MEVAFQSSLEIYQGDDINHSRAPEITFQNEMPFGWLGMLVVVLFKNEMTLKMKLIKAMDKQKL